VIVPPFDDEVEPEPDGAVVVGDDFDELPHAAITNTEARARAIPRTALKCLLTSPPPEDWSFAGEI
jgi:hypothetical protein